MALHMPLDRLDDGCGLLVGHETAGDLGMGRGRQYRFDAFVLKTAPDAVHFQCGRTQARSWVVYPGSPNRSVTPSWLLYSSSWNGTTAI